MSSLPPKTSPTARRREPALSVVGPIPKQPRPSHPVWLLAQRGLAAAFLVLLAPIWVLLYAVTRLSSPGPFLDLRRRVGWKGRPIDLWKIRTTNVTPDGGQGDLTTIGRVLRLLKLDELPQLVNVVRGELELVGPRPLPEALIQQAETHISNFRRRTEIMPGLTNLATVSVVYDEGDLSAIPDLERTFEAECHYMRYKSFSYDLVLLAMTGFFLARRAWHKLFGVRRRATAGERTVELHEEAADWLGSEESDRRPLESSRAWSWIQRAAAAGLFVALLPVFAALYLGTKLSSPGPFLFKQKRRGFLGRPFTVLKVRTMSLGSEARTALGVQNTDPAVTRFGKVLRALKLDELPQLVNVMRGEMEWVGPRPIPMALEDELRKHIPGFRRRHLVKPGLTNLGQVSVIDNELSENLIPDWSRRFEGECHYIAHKSISYDLVMITMTAGYILRKLLRRDRDQTLRDPDGVSATLVLGTPIANLDYRGVIDQTAAWIGDEQTQRYVNICPVHSLVEARLHAEHRASIEQADLNTADGMPVVWAKRLLGDSKASRVYGPTLMLRTLERAEEEGWRVAFYGGHPERLELLQDRLRKRFPELRIVFAESPPFHPLTPQEDEDVVERMNAARPDVVWVGLGCPKQERWMREHRERIRGVCFGVGAAFDFHAGTLRQAPPILQTLGLEWAFRLACEPRRLFRRYATTNPVFLGLFALQLAKRMVLRKPYQVVLADSRPAAGVKEETRIATRAA